MPLRLQLQEVAMRTVEARSRSKSSRVWDGWQDAPQLACVGRLLAAQLLLSEAENEATAAAADYPRQCPNSSSVVCDSSGEGPASSRTATSSSCSWTTAAGMTTMHQQVGGGCCCSSGYCQRCMLAAASPWELIFRFIDQVMLLHLASFLGWERSREKRQRMRREESSSSAGQDAAAAAAAEVDRYGGGEAATVSSHGSSKQKETNDSATAAAEHFLFFPQRNSAGKDGRRSEATTSSDTSSNSSRNSGSSSRSSSSRSSSSRSSSSSRRCSRTRNEKEAHASVYYRNASSRSTGKSALLDLLRGRVSFVAGGAVSGTEADAAAAADDVAVQDATAEMFESLLKYVSRFSPLRDVVWCLLLLLLDAPDQRGPLRRIRRGAERWGRYETRENLDLPVNEMKRRFSSSPLQTKLRQLLDQFERQKMRNSSSSSGSVSGEFLGSMDTPTTRDIDENRRHSSTSEDAPQQKTSSASAAAGEASALQGVRSSSSVFSGLMGAVKKKLGLVGAEAERTVSSSASAAAAASVLMRTSSHRTLRPLKRRSSTARKNEEEEPQRDVVAGDAENSSQPVCSDVWGTPITSETGEMQHQQKQKQEIVAGIPAEAKEKNGRVPETAKRNVECCPAAAAARKGEQDAFAACWLPAKEEHLAVVRVLVAALHAVFSQKSHQQNYQAAADKQTAADKQATADNWTAVDKQAAADGKVGGTREQETQRRKGESEEDEGERSVLELQHQQQRGSVEGRHEERHDGEEEVNDVERQLVVEEEDLIGREAMMASEEDSLCLFHFVAQHMDMSPHTFSVYCSEADTAQLEALRRAIDLFEGRGDEGTFVSNKMKIEVVRATPDGLLDVEDLKERLALWKKKQQQQRQQQPQYNKIPGTVAADSSGMDGYDSRWKCEEGSSSDSVTSCASPLQETSMSSPLVICCSAGRAGGTRCGFDSFVELSQLCEEYNVWLHIDASNGASLLLPQEQPFRQYCVGMEGADSILWGFSPFLFGQMSSASSSSSLAALPGSLQKSSSSPSPPPYAAPVLLSSLPCGDSSSSSSSIPVAPTELIESVWEDEFPVGLLSRHPAAFFLSKSFCCCCSSCYPDTSLLLQAKHKSAGLLSPSSQNVCTNTTTTAAAAGAAGLKTGGMMSRRDDDTASSPGSTTHHGGHKTEEGSTIVVDVAHSYPCTTTYVGPPQYESCSLFTTSGAGDEYSPAELFQDTDDRSYHPGENATTTRSPCGNPAFGYDVLQKRRQHHPDNTVLSAETPHTDDAGTRGNSTDVLDEVLVDKTRHFAATNTQKKGEETAQQTTLDRADRKRERKFVSCKERGTALAHWCGAGRKMVGLGFSIWCFWKKVGDVGVANRVRQIYLHCRRLEVFARNFPLRLKPAEYPTYAAQGGQFCRETETQRSTAERRMIKPVSGNNNSRSNEEGSYSDDVAGNYDIDRRVTFDCEYARVHEGSLRSLIADAATLLGLPKSVAMDSSAVLRSACMTFGDEQSHGSTSGTLGRKDILARTTTGGDDTTVASPFQLCPNQIGVTGRWTSPYTITFRWSRPVESLLLNFPKCPVSNGGGAAEEKQLSTTAKHDSNDTVAKKDFEDRLVVYLKNLLDTLKKRETSAAARANITAASAATTSPVCHRQHSSFTPHNKEDRTTTGIPEEGLRAGAETEESEEGGSDEDVPSASVTSGEEDEARETSTGNVPSFTLLTENFVVGVGSAMPNHDTDSAGQEIAQADTSGGLPFLTVSPVDPRMSEDEGYSLLCLVNRLAEFLWGTSGVNQGIQNTLFDPLS